ncbi:MAG: hypothetical protein CUN54_09470 [Phototrophicales bacterium]|nr:MAG: hypothetical protein CUN54_09470 [Phototrophicales bacterium]
MRPAAGNVAEATNPGGVSCDGAVVAVRLPLLPPAELLGSMLGTALMPPRSLAAGEGVTLASISEYRG